MKTLSIGITTFRNRLNDVSTQVKKIRGYDEKIPILLTINTNYGEKMPEEYRKGILSLCAEVPYTYPIFFTRYTGLAKMWNTLINHCSTTHIFIMNDDISFDNSMALNELRVQIQQEEIIKINNTFGTFVISKALAREMNYFDERLIAYGQEDGEFWTRYEEIYKHPIPNIIMTRLNNRVQNRRTDSYDSSIHCYKDAWGGFKPIVNLEIIKQLRSWPVEKQYPYEQFIENNYNNIGNFKEIIT